MNIPGEAAYKGQGISYCATCDAKYFQDKEVIIIGGGNSAIEETEFISKFASKITIITHGDALRANKDAQSNVSTNPKVTILYNSEPKEFIKDSGRMSVVIEQTKTKQRETVSADGIFVFVGMQPNVSLFENVFDVDQWGYFKVSDEMETSVAGVYSVGDINSKKFRQITTAVADGTIAAIAISKKIQ